LELSQRPARAQSWKLAFFKSKEKKQRNFNLPKNKIQLPHNKVDKKPT
jgi:hypothetical protein